MSSHERVPPTQADNVPDAPSSVHAAGEHVDGWLLERFLGAGAFGETWRAVDPEGVPCALKLLQHPPGDEMRALSGIVHPAVVGVLGAGGGAAPYLAMEFAPGRTLEDLGVLDLDPALAIAGALLDALAAVHDVVNAHGDIKPENLIVQLQDDGTVSVKLIDFGLAGGSQGGTLAWAAPERLQGGVSSPAADVYAAGMILWTMLHGIPPFGELEPGEALLKRRSSSPASNENGTVRSTLQALTSPSFRARHRFRSCFHLNCGAALLRCLSPSGASSSSPPSTRTFRLCPLA